MRCGLLGILVCSVLFAQDRVVRDGGKARLLVEALRPLDAAAILLATEFGVAVSVEELQSGPRPGKLDVSFALARDGSIENIPALLQTLVDEAKHQFGSEYRVEGRILIQEEQGKMMPLLDRLITIPSGVRSLAESAGILSQELSKQTGFRVHCCQASVAGIPWGMQSVLFGAKEEKARIVLNRLIALSLEGRPNRYYYLLRCDPKTGGWCFINLMRLPWEIDSLGRFKRE